jgi:SAM-dependent methyltransferase
MEDSKKSLDASYFNDLYGKNQDPWNFEGSEYEKGKYIQTMLMIPNGVYANVFEIGCSNGLLSMMLKDRSQKLLAVDSSSIAIGNAKKRLARFLNVTVQEMEVPRDFPDMRFDLILFSEVGYFMVEKDLITLRDKMTASLLPGGHLLMVHWTPQVKEFPLTGDQVHQVFISESGNEPNKPLRLLKNKTEEKYRMDLLQRK